MLERVCSIDPGTKNFCFLIEEFNIENIKKIFFPPHKERFIREEKKKSYIDMEPTEKYLNCLEEFWHCGRTIFYKKFDITSIKNKKEKKGKTELTIEDLIRLKDVLDEHCGYFDKCTSFVIEKQMAFGSKINPVAITIEKFIYSYFIIKYGNTKNIVVYPAYNKTQILGCPRGLDKPQRKKWVVYKADEIWTLRGDLDMVEALSEVKKADDISDCFCIGLSWVILNFSK